MPIAMNPSPIPRAASLANQLIDVPATIARRSVVSTATPELRCASPYTEVAYTDSFVVATSIYQCVAIRPMTPPISISAGEASGRRSRTASETGAITIVSGSTNAVCAS